MPASFAMVHDSYGVHACNVDLLNRVVMREEFVRIYSEPVLQNFLDQQRKAHRRISLPDPPRPETSIFSRSPRLPTFLPDRRDGVSVIATPRISVGWRC
jgi:DNA-dependent RNA polymerase